VENIGEKPTFQGLFEDFKAVKNPKTAIFLQKVFPPTHTFSTVFFTRWGKLLRLTK